MSIWTDLLIMHGHIAPTALALIMSPRSAAPVVVPDAAPDQPPQRPDLERCDRPALQAQHPLRAMGQLR